MSLKSAVVLIFLFAIGTTAASSQFCNIFERSSTPVVTNAFNIENNAAPWNNILGLAVLTILMVFAALSVVYAIGTAFGINKLVAYSRAEYAEGIFTLAIIALVGGSTAYIGHVMAFISSATNIGITNNQTPTNAYGLYLGLCNNIVANDVLPDMGSVLGILVKLIPYEILQTFAIKIAPAAITFIPTVSFSPFSGMGIVVSATFLEFSTLSVFIFIGISLIFFFMLIYFLFPLFLYLGILLRSFPWTRAAGGSFIALFVAFYLIFPVIFYPFTARQQSQISESYCRNSPIPCPSPQPGIVAFFTNAFTYIMGLVSVLFGNLPGVFVGSIDDYAQSFSNIALELIGLGISFIISFDLMEVMADFLGAPSLQGNRILEKMI